MATSLLVPTRRCFVQGLAAVTGLGAFDGQRASAQFIGGIPVLTGTKIDLTLGEMPVNVTGRSRMATVVNNVMPGPILRLREGDDVTINVTNKLLEASSVHWHGIKLPNPMDGVPGLTFAGIPPGQTFTYRFPIQQSGTYWYHSHSGMQEQTGLFGPLIFEPQSPEPYHYDRDYVVVLSDWTDEDPMMIVSNLKQQSDYYDFQRRTLGTFIKGASKNGLAATIQDRLMWGKMRMSPTDIMDVTGATYTFLINGQPPAANWTGLFRPGERVRLRFINSASMTTFDVRIPGLPLTIVQADGSDIEPVEIDEFRIGVAETYDAIVEPKDDRAYTIFAQAQDRSGFARATLATLPGTTGDIPSMDPPPLRTMTDMGMAGMDMSAMAGMQMNADSASGHMPGMDMSKMSGMSMGSSSSPSSNASGVDPRTLSSNPQVDNVAMAPQNRLDEAGTGMDGNGRRVLRYNQLKSITPVEYPAEATRDIEFHLTGNMERFVWGFDGKKFSEAPPVPVNLGETVRFVLINDTMMEHPIHLHGFLFAVENGQGNRQPLKHTINVKPGERASFVYTADVPGRWAFHCHLQFHMETGMFRTVLVA
jgi:CopA family copper-resistance protein